jgi:hypothetical protein
VSLGAFLVVDVDPSRGRLTLSKTPRPWSATVRAELARRGFCPESPGFWGSPSAAYGDIATAIRRTATPRFFLQKKPGAAAVELDASSFRAEGCWRISLDDVLGGGATASTATVIVEDVSSERVAIGTVLASLPAVGIATAWLGGQRTSPEFGNKLSVMYSDAINRHVSARTHRTYPHPHTHCTHPHTHCTYPHAPAHTRTCDDGD